jgi:hypothetical protein
MTGFLQKGSSGQLRLTKIEVYNGACAYRGVFTFIHRDKRNSNANACSRFKKRFRGEFQIADLKFQMKAGSGLPSEISDSRVEIS